MTAEPVKFLLVDDVEDNLLALEALLRRDGLVCVKASSGSEALELLLEQEFALALLDVQMPGMDGFELAELMRGAERTKHIPIIFVTAGSRDPGRLFKGYESGAVDFLYKPIEPRILQGKAEVFFELYEKRKEYAQILAMNEMFVGVLSHDLRNPLGTILTGAQLLQAQSQDEKQQKTLQRMAAAGRRMADMIEQLLDLTRARVLDGAGFASERQRVDLTALAQRAIDELQGAYPERQLVFGAHGECVTTGDPGRLLQLFSNLVGNAIRYGEPGTPVTIEVSCDDSEVSVSVHNVGAIASHVVPTLFDPFRQRSRNNQSGGLGLGLYISQQIAVAHGGVIDVASSSEAGSTFTVRLPRRPLNESLESPPAVSRQRT
jgi:two-component system, sensor histidine kinase and response regulator